jgi:hypothetical protein
MRRFKRVLRRISAREEAPHKDAGETDLEALLRSGATMRSLQDALSGARAHAHAHAAGAHTFLNFCLQGIRVCLYEVVRRAGQLVMNAAQGCGVWRLVGLTHVLASKGGACMRQVLPRARARCCGGMCRTLAST